MCNRRNKPIWQATVLLALVGGLGYTFYLYNLATMDLDASRSEADKYLHQQESLSSQLQVVYEHRARLERSLQKEKADHKNAKLDFSKKQNAFLLNVTRSKHEAMNRFNSLETQYNMLKAQAKELQTDYGRLQQQYSRLSSEHGLVVNEQKRNFQVYKEQKANEILSLTEEVKTLKEQVVSLRIHLKSKSEEMDQYKLSSSTALAASQKYQEKLRMLQEEFATYKEGLKLDVSEKDKRRVDNNMGGDGVSHSIKIRVDEQVKRGHRKQRTHSTTAKISYLQGLNSSQIDKQTKSLSGKVGSMRSLERNLEKQDSHAVGDRKTREVIDSVETAVARDISENEVYSRHDNIPLRDSSEDTLIVPAKNNTENRWSDIIKAAKQSLQSEIQETSELKKVRRDAENVRKEWNEDEQSLGGQKIDSNQNSLPVVQPEIVGDRQDQRRSQYDALSREEINRQVAELRNHREQAAQPQLKVASTLPVQRQDELQQKADNDEEDVGKTKSQQEADPDEEDPDEDKVPEQQFHDRSLKAEAGAAVQNVNDEKPKQV